MQSKGISRKAGILGTSLSLPNPFIHRLASAGSKVKLGETEMKWDERGIDRTASYSAVRDRGDDGGFRVESSPFSLLALNSDSLYVFCARRRQYLLCPAITGSLNLDRISRKTLSSFNTHL